MYIPEFWVGFVAGVVVATVMIIVAAVITAKGNETRECEERENGRD